MSDAPLPPAPLLSPLQAGFAALAAAAGALWGYLNSRGQRGYDPAAGIYLRSGTGTYTVSFEVGEETQVRYECGTGNYASSSVGGYGPVVRSTNGSAVGVMLYNMSGGTYNQGCGTPKSADVQNYRVYRIDSNGSLSQLTGGTYKTGTQVSGGVPQVRFDSVHNGPRGATVTKSGVAVPIPPFADPFVVPPFIPQPELLPDEEETPFAPIPTRPPIAPPDTAPPDAEPLPPTGDPGPGTGTGTGTGTATGGAGQLLPLRPPIFFPVPPPTGTEPEIGEGVARPPVVVVPAPVTPPGQEQIPGGVIGQPGTAPPPTLDGIAAEVGRIEQKVRAILDKPSEGADLGALLDLLQLLLSLLQQVYGPGSYELAPVCEDKDPAVVNWQGGIGAFGQVNVKLDALAELLQAHKNSRQPVCATKASGQPVTVVFEEI